MSSPYGPMTRLDLPCEMAGFPAPGFRLRLDFPAVVEDPLEIVCRTTPDRVGASGRWLESFGAVRVQWGPGLAPRELRAWFEELRAPLARLLSLRPNHAEVSAGGVASLFVRAGIDEITAFAAAGGAVGRTRPAAPPPGRGTLSARQREALSTAVALGYYDLPRAVSLRAIARNIGVSLGSLSELLRRAEMAVLSGYVDSLSLTESDGGSRGDATAAGSRPATPGNRPLPWEHAPTAASPESDPAPAHS